MIHQHRTIELFGKPLFTAIDMETPMTEMLPIPSEACFTYFVKADDQQLAAQPSISAHSHHAILSLCGMTLGKMLIEQEPGNLSSLIVHFHPEILQEIYKDSKPHNGRRSRPRW